MFTRAFARRGSPGGGIIGRRRVRTASSTAPLSNRRARFDASPGFPESCRFDDLSEDHRFSKACTPVGLRPVASPPGRLL